ncbi:MULTISPECIES: dihydrolipoamide acetyltransferase family protein [Actinomadura]|uniref:Dihydrolipoamide acetyltransferase component of pyruvate dehydrogenase complex n=1 Tax=Actinomadura madurae TaxID=1993 RepID=A0A1I4ZF69_9ACTN|nr:dihydrolipoamide acetyltransferase family protein [Actinomadura madurae]MCP9965955.1 2-oxo acid dehydrogenase subunit E2 [Actinomadura madurae]MCQ0010043.1 2-oxo acid dehydrogenase subunit E2 [Actinomadura madurae]MCQ0014637.1 2-oxo acid dehydrogenase subunit E2 [Actinomadura madurae]SFN48827.1 pyruvate dehydrogenase E2 component (dihydrolipoamide acetyltransferase) [Actinomadura madurae]SPT49791.1 Dihydrolipoyllysine-residue acetyltransferase component of pyruvate dehydrogenase complex [Ac
MTEILMPRLSDTMEEGVISSWQKQPGDEVAVGDVIVDIETDKAVMEYEAYEAGVLEKILVKEGDSAAIGAPIAVIAPVGGAKPAAASAPAAEPAAEAEPEPAPAAEPEPAAAPAAPAPAPRPPGASRPPSSPLARRLARDHGIDLATLTGSGPGGRIVRADIEAAIRTGAPAPAPAAPAPAVQAPPVQGRADDPDVEAVPLNRFRKVAAKRLGQSKREAPHFYLNREVDAEALLAFRATLNEALAPAKVSVNDLVVKAAATALREHPAVNVSYTEENLLFHKRIHVGVAVAVEDGLVVPVVRDADRKSVSEIGREARELAGKAREGKLSAQEMSGGTFSVSNLGMFGVDSFSAVINPPEAAILAVGAVRDEPVVRDGQVVPGKRMAVTLSVDHRATDGATAAKFLARLAELLQNPLLIVA